MSDLTHQQQLFCQKYIECKGNASEAYRQSYDCEESSDNTIKTEAYKLLQNPYLTHTIEVLQAEAAKRNEVTVDSLTAEYEQVRVLALEAAEYNPVIAAINGKAKIHGFDKASLALTGKDGGILEQSITVRYVDAKDEA